MSPESEWASTSWISRAMRLRSLNAAASSCDLRLCFELGQQSRGLLVGLLHAAGETGDRVERNDAELRRGDQAEGAVRVYSARGERGGSQHEHRQRPGHRQARRRVAHRGEQSRYTRPAMLRPHEGGRRDDHRGNGGQPTPARLGEPESATMLATRTSRATVTGNPLAVQRRRGVLVQRQRDDDRDRGHAERTQPSGGWQVS